MLEAGMESHVTWVRNSQRWERCPLCHSKNIRGVGVIDYRQPILFSTIHIRLKDIPELGECAECDSFFTQNIVPEAIAFEMYGRGKSCEKWPRNRDLAEEKSENIISRFDQYCAERKKVLDIGCNTGILLDYARARGCDTAGVEPSSASRDILSDKGHAAFASIEGVTGRYDVIAAFDLVEHLYDLPKFFNVVSNLLVPDGVILLLTGDIHSLSARLSREHWWYLKAPEHIVFPSRKVLGNIDGFTLVSIDGTYASRGYHRSLFLGVAQYIRKLLLPGEYEGLPSLGPDHMLVTLRKIVKL